jgi:hypothetical protein
MTIILGPAIEGAHRPSFHASLNGEAAIVELDSGAVFRLAENAAIPDLPAVLQAKRDQIRDAASRLIQNGFVTRHPDRLEILVTALDL